MTNSEAKALAAQVGWEGVNCADYLFTVAKECGCEVAVEHETGDWVILNSKRFPIARVS